jgi:hypothetical protein
VPHIQRAELASESQELGRALDWLAGQARDRRATREDYEHVASMIISRARNVIATEEEFLRFESEVVQGLRNALEELAEKVLDKKSTRKDYERIVDFLRDRARAVGSGSTGR